MGLIKGIYKLVIPMLAVACTCSCTNTWNEDDKTAWRQACMETAGKWSGSEARANTYCDCVLNKIITRYPNLNDALEHLDELAKDTAMKTCREMVEASK